MHDCHFCLASFFSFQIIQGFFFTCAPVGWSPPSLKESHSIQIATYRTQARKKLNLHRLRWMLGWSWHFVFCSHDIAVLHCLFSDLLEGGGGHEQHFMSLVIICYCPVPSDDIRSDVNVCRGITVYSIPPWIKLNRDILESGGSVWVHQPDLSSQWVHSSESSESRHIHRAERRLPWNQLSLYSPNTLLKDMFAAAFQEQRGIAVVTFNFTDRMRRIFWDFFFFFFLSLHEVPQNLTDSICQCDECVKRLLLSICSKGPSASGLEHTHYTLAILHQSKCNHDQM